MKSGNSNTRNDFVVSELHHITYNKKKKSPEFHAANQLCNIYSESYGRQSRQFDNNRDSRRGSFIKHRRILFKRNEINCKVFLPSATSSLHSCQSKLNKYNSVCIDSVNGIWNYHFNYLQRNISQILITLIFHASYKQWADYISLNGEFRCCNHECIRLELYLFKKCPRVRRYN